MIHSNTHFLLTDNLPQTASQNVAWICCSRIIAGVGVGFFIAVIPTWSAEISNAGTRGETFSWVFVANCEYLPP